MANVKLGARAVGSIVKIKVNGASKDFIVVQQGNPNTGTYDASCDGTWLLMKDIYTLSLIHILLFFDDVVELVQKHEGEKLARLVAQRQAVLSLQTQRARA